MQEVRRAGEHTTPADALQLLLWELHGSLLATLQQLLQTSSSQSYSTSNGNVTGPAAGHAGSHRVLTEKGVLQLLFDQRFMRDVLGGGKPLSAVSAGSSTQSAAAANGGGAAAAATDVAGRKKLVSGIEQQLQVRVERVSVWTASAGAVLCLFGSAARQAGMLATGRRRDSSHTMMAFCG